MNNQNIETTTTEQDNKTIQLDSTKSSLSKTSLPPKQGLYKNFSALGEEDAKYYDSKEIKIERIFLK